MKLSHETYRQLYEQIGQMSYRLPTVEGGDEFRPTQIQNTSTDSSVDFTQFVAVKVVLQQIMGTVLLLILYVFVIGLTSIVMRLFFRKRLRHPTVDPASSWVLAAGYDSDVESTRFQS